MRVLCIGRHPYLSGHISRYFERLGLDVATAVGIEDALRQVRLHEPDVVVCDYDLLAAAPLTPWTSDAQAAALPLIAASLTRRCDEMVFAPSQVVGCLYLPVVAAEDVLAVLRLAASRGGVALPGDARVAVGTYAARGARLGARTAEPAPR